MLYDHSKLIGAIEEIKRVREVNYQDIALAINVTPSFFSQVRAGKKMMSYDTFMLFCKTFNIDPPNLADSEESDEVVTFKIGNAIGYWMDARRVPISKLSDLTGIDMFMLYDIVNGDKQPTREQLNQIAKALEIESKVFEPDYAEEFARIRRSLKEVMHLPDDKITLIFEFIEKSLR